MVLVYIFCDCFSLNATTPWAVCKMKMPSRGNRGTDTGITSDRTNNVAGTGDSTLPVWQQTYLLGPLLAVKGSEKVLWVMVRQQELRAEGSASWHK